MEAIIDEPRQPTDRNDPLAGSPWSAPGTVAGFVQSPPNQALLSAARAALGSSAARLLDIGCGAGRNAVPLAQQGWQVVGTDLSRAMLDAAASRVREAQAANRVQLVLTPMTPLPFASRSFDFVVAHGIWNLARSAGEFRAAVAEAARVARAGSPLFVFTFSRATLPETAVPEPGEPFVFTQFSGDRQCFLTGGQLVSELAAGGFVPDPAVGLRELNRPAPGALRTRGAPVIYEGMFRRT